MGSEMCIRDRVNFAILVISINYVILVILVKPDYDEYCDSENFGDFC